MQQQRRRNGIIIGLLSLGLLAGAALTSPPAQAVDAVGPYYADPAWDQSLPVATRFVVLTNWGSKAVLDKETGLVWEKTLATTTSTWLEARKACTALVTGGRKGWRLPSIPELASLVDPSVALPSPTLPPGHPFTTGGATGVLTNFPYWSATTFAEDSSIAWFVNFGNGFVSISNKVLSFHAWCVRGGMNADRY
jgi:hypothetical protein